MNQQKGKDLSKFYQMFNEDSTVIVMNGSKDNYGKIAHWNKSIH